MEASSSFDSLCSDLYKSFHQKGNWEGLDVSIIEKESGQAEIHLANRTVPVGHIRSLFDQMETAFQNRADALDSFYEKLQTSCPNKNGTSWKIISFARTRLFQRVQMNYLLQNSSYKQGLACDQNGNSAIHLAATLGDLKALEETKKILKTGFQNDYGQDFEKSPDFLKIYHAKLLAWQNMPNIDYLITPLMKALSNSQYAFAEALIKEGVDINAQDKMSRSIVHQAIQSGNGNTQNLDFCLQLEGINPCLREVEGMMPLHLAASKNKKNCVEKLLKDSRIQAHLNDTDVYGRTALRIALQEKNDSIIRLLLNDPSADVSKLPGYGVKPPMISMDHIEKQLIQYLTLLGNSVLIDPQGICNGLGFFAPYYFDRGKINDFFNVLELIATWDRQLETLKNKESVRGLTGDYQDFGNLINHWINDIVMMQGEYEPIRVGSSGEFPHFQINRPQQFDILKKTDSNLTIDPILPPFESFIQEGFPKMSREQLAEFLSICSCMPRTCLELRSPGHLTSGYVLDDGRIFYYEPNYLYRTKIFENPDEVAESIQNIKHRFAGRNWKTMSEDLMIYRYVENDKKSPLKINKEKLRTLATQKSPNKFSAYHFAVFANDVQWIKDLQNNQSIDPHTPDAMGIPPLVLALHMQKWEVAKVLLEDPRITVKEKENMFFWAVSKCRISCVRFLLENGKTFHFIDAFNEIAFMTSLEMAIKFNYSELMQLLLAEGADPLNIHHQQLTSPAYALCSSSNLELFDTFLKSYPHINKQDVQGNTLLHIAAHSQNSAFIKRLLDNGANPDLKNLKGQTYLDVVKEIKQ